MPTQISSAKVVLDGQKAIAFCLYITQWRSVCLVVLLLIRDAQALMDRKDGCLWLMDAYESDGCESQFRSEPIYIISACWERLDPSSSSSSSATGENLNLARSARAAQFPNPLNLSNSIMPPSAITLPICVCVWKIIA